jgi:predicted ester cyclase
MSTDTNKKIVQRFVTEYQTGNNQQVLRDTIADTLVNHTPMSPDAPGGVEEVKGIFDMFHAAFEGFTAEIVDQLAEGDKVMTYKTFSGTHTGEFMGIPPTGKHVRFDVMDIIRLADGRFVEHWGLVDQAGLLRQLGAL